MTLPPEGGLQQALLHERSLRRLAAALLRDPADADEAVQHALVQEASGRRQPGTPLWPFLRTALQRHAANLRKLTSRRARHEARAARPEAVPAADEIVQREQLRRRVADAVLALAEPYRTTVWLRWFEDLTTSEVAERMQVPMATVRTRLQRAHAQLRQRLDREYGDRRWAALALPMGGAVVAVPSTLAVMLTMKKTLIATAVLLALSGLYLLAPRPDAVSTGASPTDRPVTGATGAMQTGESARESGRSEMAITLPALTTPRLLQILHADGRPAERMPVWFWTDEGTRPQWTRRIAAGQFSEAWPAGIGPLRGEAPRTADANTDRHGQVEVPDGPAPVCVTVSYADEQLFSTELSPSGGPVILPDLAQVSVTLVDAPAGGHAVGWYYLAWRDADGEPNFGWACENVDTGSGPGVLRCGARRFRMAAGERLDLSALRGHEVAFTAWGRGFALQPEQAFARAPDSVAFRCTGLVPQLLVSVTEPSGTPTDLGGRAWLRVSDAGGTFEDLEQGEAAFAVGDLSPGVHPVDVLMDDGEWLHADEPPIGPKDTTLRLRRGTGRPPVHVRVSGLPPAEGIAEVNLENAAGQVSPVAPFADLVRVPRDPGYVPGRGELLLNMLPGDAIQGHLVTRDLRVARFAAAAPGAFVEGSWLPGAPPRTIDVGALYREHGDLVRMEAHLELELRDARGLGQWRSVLRHIRYPFIDHVTPPPVWRDLQLPLALRARVLIKGGENFDLLREIDLTPR